MEAENANMLWEIQLAVNEPVLMEGQRKRKKENPQVLNIFFFHLEWFYTYTLRFQLPITRTVA